MLIQGAKGLFRIRAFLDSRRKHAGMTHRLMATRSVIPDKVGMAHKSHA
jgi:hypothetical protein